MNEGWISVHRKILDKPIWSLSTPEQKVILVTILLMVNHTENEWEWKGKRFTCKAGQLISSLEKIAQNSGKGISIQNVRTAISRFEKYEFLTNESTKQSRLITICNWEEYQQNKYSPNKDTNKQLTDSQQTPNNQLTTNNNVNNDNKIVVEDIKEKGWRENFQIYLSEVTDAYDKIIKDNDFIKDRERYYPNIDIKLSLEKCFRDYWSTEVAWTKKKKTRTKKLDWVSTFRNSLDQKMNQVYKQRSNLFSQQSTSTTEKLCRWEIPQLGDKRTGTYQQYEADLKRNSSLQVNFLGYVE